MIIYIIYDWVLLTLRKIVSTAKQKLKMVEQIMV